MPEHSGAAALIADAGALGAALDTAQAQRLLAFAALLERSNRAFNLVSRRDVGRLVSRHLLDSLSLAPLLPGGEVMDLGTGGGLPGVPLAIARGDVRFTLVDRSERKVRFVARTIRELELENATVCCADLAAVLPADAPAALAAGGGFAAVVSRAVADPARLWALAAGHLRRDGVLMIMHHGQRGAGVPGPLTVPAGARIVAERQVDIPGLPDPHGIVVLGREVSGEGE